MTKGTKKAPAQLSLLDTGEFLKSARKSASTKPKTTSKLSPIRMAMQKEGVPMTCAVTGCANSTLECAHIYPDCWIKDGTFAMTSEELAKKFLVETDRPLSLHLTLRDPTKKRLPAKWKDEWRELLNGPKNRIYLDPRVHKLFDRTGGGKRGCWSLVPKKNPKDGTAVPGKYYVMMANDESRKEMKSYGVRQRKLVTIPHIDPRLAVWHSHSVMGGLPTAGPSDDEFSEGADSFVHPDEESGRQDLQREFLAEDQAMMRSRLPMPDHAGLVRCK